MANVLPIKDRRIFRRNYWLRLFVTSSVMITSAITVGIVALVPSYISAKAELAETTQYSELQDDVRVADTIGTSMVSARLANVQISELTNALDTSADRAIDLVMRDWSIHADNVIISGFTYAVIEEKEVTVSTLRVSGEALDRATLNAFVQTLRSDPALLEVSFPISDLAGGGTLDFSLVVKFK